MLSDERETWAIHEPKILCRKSLFILDLKALTGRIGRRAKIHGSHSVAMALVGGHVNFGYLHIQRYLDIDFKL